MEHKTLLEMHEKAYNANASTRRTAADDMVFYNITQWAGIEESSPLLFKGEFNVIAKGGRQILSDLSSNPVQIDFEPLDGTRDDAAELLDGIYRTDDNHNTAIEAYENAKFECMVCGFGAWRVYSTYESLRTKNKNQVVRRLPIYEANNCVFFDPNAKLLDKSDADYVAVLTFMTVKGYIQAVKDLSGKEITEQDVISFAQPYDSLTFPWMGGGDNVGVYIGEIYNKKVVKKKVITFEDPFGEETSIKQEDVFKEMDEMMDAGYILKEEIEQEFYEVTQYICSGMDILSEQVITGENLPIIPMYGEHGFVEGMEFWQGITKLAKDPQRLRNFAMSYAGTIVSQSPLPKDIYLPDQIKNYESMYAENGAENQYPYLLQNKVDATGADLPLGAVGSTSSHEIPPSLMAMIELSTGAVSDVIEPGLPQDVADPDMSGKAIYAIQNQISKQSSIFQLHFKHAKRRDAEVYTGIAKEIYDVPRKVYITKPDGTRTETQIMDQVIDDETGELVTLRDINNSEFDVYSKIGPAYTTAKEQTVERLTAMLSSINPQDPMHKIVMLKIFELMDGVDFDDIRDYAKKESLLLGVRQPETPEEEQVVQASQENQQPDANMVLAMAEDKKGQAAQKQAQIDQLEMTINAQLKDEEIDIKAYDAETKRMETQIKAQQAGANIEKTNVDAYGTKIDNEIKKKELDLSKQSDDELLEKLLRRTG